MQLDENTLASPAEGGVGPAETEVETRVAKYLTFDLGSERYCLEILEVREVIGLPAVTPVPRSHPSVRGVINLRGRIVPVFDLRTRFGLAAIAATDEASILVVDAIVAGIAAQVGLLVDRVCEVVSIPRDDVDPAPAVGGGGAVECIGGVAKTEAGMLMVLDVDRIVDLGSWRRDTPAVSEEGDSTPGSRSG